MRQQLTNITASVRWRAIAVGVAVLLALAAAAVALERQVARNAVNIENFETWRVQYDKDFREMRQEVKDIRRWLYEGE